jgi:hypothetical protein
LDISFMATTSHIITSHVVFLLRSLMWIKFSFFMKSFLLRRLNSHPEWATTSLCLELFISCLWHLFSLYAIL